MNLTKLERVALDVLDNGHWHDRAECVRDLGGVIAQGAADRMLCDFERAGLIEQRAAADAGGHLDAGPMIAVTYKGQQAARST